MFFVHFLWNTHMWHRGYLFKRTFSRILGVPSSKIENLIRKLSYQSILSMCVMQIPSMSWLKVDSSESKVSNKVSIYR